VVAGASSGIGKAFAELLAGEGFDLILSARREDRLLKLSEALREAYRVNCRIVPLDLADEDAASRLDEETRDIDVGLLVNNAGFSINGRFEGHDPGRLAEMIRVNCTAPVLLARAFIGRMRRRKRSGILFVASVAGYQGTPYMACYGASKGFDLLFGEALAREMSGSGIDVTVLSPGSTQTEFHEVAGALLHPGADPEKVAMTGLEALGRKHTVVPGLSVKLQASAYRLFPRRFVTLCVKAIMARMTPKEKQ